MSVAWSSVETRVRSAMTVISKLSLRNQPMDGAIVTWLRLVAKVRPAEPPSSSTPTRP